MYQGIEVKYNFKKREKEEKGITLIALVITIIVLLILAGVSVAMLVGQNGILSKAQDIKGTNAYASAVEQAKLAYMAVKTEIMTQTVVNSSYDATENAGKLAKIVKKDLSESEWAVTLNNTVVSTETGDLAEGNKIKMTYTNQSLRAGMVDGNKPTFDGYIEFEIGLTGQDAKLSIDSGLVIKDSSGKAINLANIAEYYGHDVTYHNQTYQLFYVDTVGKYSNGDPRIWLQYKNLVSGIQLSANYETTGISTANSILWQVNPDLNSKYGEKIRGLNTTIINGQYYRNLRGVAYLCNPERWNSIYIGTNKLAQADIAKGAYAIGGVSAEMFCDSYNQARGKISTDEYYFDAKAFNESGTYGYKYKNSGGYGITTFGSLQTATANGIYKNESGYNVWLASPSAHTGSDVCYVRTSYNYLADTSSTYAQYVRPAVSLPADIQIQLVN